MATFLTNPKMAPALADRIEGSVRGKRSRPGDAARSALRVAIARAVVVLAVLAVVAFVIVSRQKENQELERKRKVLLDEIVAQSSSVTEQDRGAQNRDESWLSALSGAYEGDLIDPSLRPPGALGTALSRSTVYVRGPLEAFGSSMAVARTAAMSVKDSVLLCMLDTPPARTEKDMTSKVRIAYAGGERLEQATANVRDLQEVYMGTHVLLPSWEERVEITRDERELANLTAEWERAHIERAKLALRAELLIATMDERGAGSSELDGERPHDVRLAIVDLTAHKVLLRLRKHVDPKGWTETARSEYASGLDGCALAVDVTVDVKR